MKNTPILLTWFHDYHTFKFVKDIIPVLLEADYNVTLLTCDKTLKKQFEPLCNDKFKISYRPYLRPIMRLMDNKYLRPSIWLFGWVWSFLATLRYAVVIAPRDTTPFYHMITSWKPTLICRPALGFNDKTYIQHKFNPNISFPDVMKFTREKHGKTDSLFGGSFLKDVRGNKKLKYYTALGNLVAEFLQKLGTPKDHVFVTGNFSYEGLTPRTVKASEIEEKYFKDIDKDIYMFFSSQQYFGEAEIKSLHRIAEEISANNAYFVIKVHPKLDEKQLEKLEQWVQTFFPQTVKIIHDLKGDYNNACLIALSKAVIIEESNVGILAMHFDKPVIITDLGGKKDCEDNIFIFSGEILVCKNIEHLSEIIKSINIEENLNLIINTQQKFVRDVCFQSQSPCGHIPNILKEIVE